MTRPTRILALLVLSFCFSVSAAFADATGSIFFSSDGGAGGSNIQLILNGGAPINSSDSGWYDNFGVHDPDNTNYIVGLCSDCGGELFRNFFVFDIPVGFVVSSATLFLDTFTYDSLNASQIYTLYDISTNLGNLLGGLGGVGAYNDLGSGVSYGDRVYTAADENAFRSINLNAAAIAAIQAAAGGQFALGGSLEDGQVVPEPATLSLIALSLGALLAARRRSHSTR